MKKYRFNALMTGLLYFAGTAFGVAGTVAGGSLLSDLVTHKPMPAGDLLQLAGAASGSLTAGAFFVFLMGLSLTGMTVFLYPVIRRDSEELALGMLLFRGALEGAWYFASALGILIMAVLGTEYAGFSGDGAALQVIGRTVYRVQGVMGPMGTIFFLIGASCLYASFYRTRLIPRWLTIWGFAGVVPYMAYALLKFFHVEHGILFYLQMVLAPQELVMGLWLVIRGFNVQAAEKLK